MPLSRDFKHTVRERAERDPAFRLAMVHEAVAALVRGEAFDTKTLIRHYINATVGFAALGEAIGRHPKSLMRMFSPSGNPSLNALADVLAEISRREGYVVNVGTAASAEAPARSLPRRPKADVAA